MKNYKGIIIVWVAYQRRSESLAKYFDLRICYHHYSWEEKGKYLKPFAYICKFIQTIYTLIINRPKVVFVQVPPTFPLYPVYVYCKLFGAVYIGDCHNTTFYDSYWRKFPFIKSILRKAKWDLVHNEDIVEKIKNDNYPYYLMRDPIPQIEADTTVEIISNLKIKTDEYVIIPGSFDVDEPLQELFNAMNLLPQTTFVCTWFKERVPKNMQLPKNVLMTGFLPVREFNALYANANAAIVLTTREGTQPSGAAEAISLEVPLVVSDIATTRRLYSEAAVFVKSDGASIADGVKFALQNQIEIREKMKKLKQKISAENNQQLINFKEMLKPFTEKL